MHMVLGVLESWTNLLGCTDTGKTWIEKKGRCVALYLPTRSYSAPSRDSKAAADPKNSSAILGRRTPGPKYTLYGLTQFYLRLQSLNAVEHRVEQSKIML